jgi:amino acid permease
VSASYPLRFCLCPRHVQIAGTIGTGLFLGSGSALRGAGPLGALLAYALVGTVAYSSVHISLPSGVHANKFEGRCAP